MDKTCLKNNKIQWIAVLAAALLLVLEFLANRAVPFMMDDLWYSTNLATGEPLKGLKDILESQVWHYRNWGGRSMTHAALQLTLMSGELSADICNVVMMLFLTVMICVIAGKKSPLDFLLVHSMIYAWNANLKMSVLWQAGGVNYVYSSVWILLFLWPFFRSLEHPEKKRLPLVDVWILPMAVLAGWSNENMGPTCFLLAVGVMVYLAKREKKRPESWMITGAVCSLAGSILVIVAPGNFLRSSVVDKPNLWERFFSMLTAGVDFLLPSAVGVVVLLLVRLACQGRKLRPIELFLLAGAVLSYGAMALSPHYPDRATFGTMILCILLCVILPEDWETMGQWRRDPKVLLCGCFWICAVLRLTRECMPG